MSSHPRQPAVVPALNEGATVARVLDRTRERASEFVVVVIDDDTAEVAEPHGARVLRHPFDLSMGAGSVQSALLGLKDRVGLVVEVRRARDLFDAKAHEREPVSQA